MSDVEQERFDPIETTVLADAIEDRFAREYAMDRVDASAFTSPTTSMVWERLAWLHDHGQPVIREAFQMGAPAFAAVTYRPVGVSDMQAVDLLRERMWRRVVAREAKALADDATNPDVPVDRLARWTVDGIGLSAANRPAPLPSLDDLADRFEHAPYDWLFPELLERGDRLILVAREGQGKSTLFRQWAYQAACGVHWATGRRCDPLRVLLIDAENSERQTGRAAGRLRAIARQVAAQTGYDAPKVMIEHGLDLTRPLWRDRIEGHLDVERPDVVIIGPLYKVFSFRSQLSFEENATQAVSIIDDWRHRYGIAVVLEAHAAKGEDDAAMDPRGSGVFKGWPEFGRSLIFDKDNDAYRFGYFRQDRDVRVWPEWWFKNQHPGGWPWVPWFGERAPGGVDRAVPAVQHVQGAWDERLDEEPF